MSPLVNQYNDRLKDYVDVKERIRLFYERFPDGRLVTAKVKVTNKPDGVPRVWVHAMAFRTPDDLIPGDGWSWMTLPGSTPYTRGSEIENTETSAWGRAIGSLGIGIEKSIASANEIANKEGQPEAPDPIRDGLIGTAEVGKGDADFELRETPDGWRLAFRLTQGRKGYKVISTGDLAQALAAFRPVVEGQRVQVWGTLHDETYMPKGARNPVTYQVVHAERVQTPDGTLPAPPNESPAGTEEPAGDSPPIAPGQEAFDMGAVDAEVVTVPDLGDTKWHT